MNPVSASQRLTQIRRVDFVLEFGHIKANLIIYAHLLLSLSAPELLNVFTQTVELRMLTGRH